MIEVTSALASAYRKARAPVFVLARDTGGMVECRERATFAYRTARVQLQWRQAGGDVVNSLDLDRDAMRADPDEFGGYVRLVVTPDEHSPPDDFDGSERDLKEARDRADRDGMWGVRAQYWSGAEWEDVDSVWGFIGDDWRGSGYDIDLMRAALDALAEHNTRIARDLEAARPDLYGA